MTTMTFVPLIKTNRIKHYKIGFNLAFDTTSKYGNGESRLVLICYSPRVYHVSNDHKRITLSIKANPRLVLTEGVSREQRLRVA